MAIATGFRAIGFRASVFFGARFGAAAFLFGATFLLALLLTETLDFAVFREAAFCATARFAFGRVGFELGVRLFAPDFGEDRCAAARDVERLRPFETALICEAKVERLSGLDALEVAVAE